MRKCKINTYFPFETRLELKSIQFQVPSWWTLTKFEICFASIYTCTLNILISILRIFNSLSNFLTFHQTIKSNQLWLQSRHTFPPTNSSHQCKNGVCSPGRKRVIKVIYIWSLYRPGSNWSIFQPVTHFPSPWEVFVVETFGWITMVPRVGSRFVHRWVMDGALNHWNKVCQLIKYTTHGWDNLGDSKMGSRFDTLSLWVFFAWYRNKIFKNMFF